MFKFRDYQLEAINFGVDCLNKYKIVRLNMKQRLGKTFTALGIAQAVGAKRVLFITKARRDVRKSIEDDYNTLSPPFELDIQSMDSIYNASRFKPYGSDKVNKVETKAISRIVFPRELYQEYDLCIIDEVHNFKGNDGKKVKRVEIAKKLISNLPQIHLTGTPTPEGWTGLYSQLSISQFSPFAKYRNFYEWARDFVDIRQKKLYGGNLFNDYSRAKINKIEPLLKPFTLSYDESYANFNYPEVTEQIHMIETPDCLKKMMSDIVSYKMTTYMRKVITADTAVKQLGKLHQLSSGHIIFSDDINESERIIISNFKIDYIRKNILPKHKKLAIFYKYVNELEQLKTLPNTTTDAYEFEESEQAIFLGQFVSSREGVKLSTADAMVFYNLDFAFVSFEQAKSRFQHQNRQTEPILHLLFTTHGIEQKIYEALKKKKTYDTRWFRKDYVRR